MALKSKAIWLSYDLGLKGNYSSLFTFLDNHRAIECGNGVAYFRYNNDNLLKSKDLIKKLKDELAEAMSPGSNDRVYVIWRDDDNQPTTKVKGKFLFGGRKSAPWNGYSDYLGVEEEEDAS